MGFTLLSLRGVSIYRDDEAIPWGMRLPRPATPDLIGDGLVMTKGVVPRFSPGQLQKCPKLDEKSNGLPNTEEVKEEWSRL